MNDMKPTGAGMAFFAAFLLGVLAISWIAIEQGFTVDHLAMVGFIAIITLIMAFGAAILWAVLKGDIGLYGIISEPDGKMNVKGKPKASLSRFQFLIFTFVVAGLFLLLSIEAGTFVNVPENVLLLIGLSGGGFVLSKSVSGMKGADGEMTETQIEEELAELEKRRKALEAKRKPSTEGDGA